MSTSERVTRASKIAGIWLGMIIGVFALAFEVFNLDTMSNQAAAGGIFFACLIAAIGGAVTLTRRVHKS